MQKSRLWILLGALALACVVQVSFGQGLPGSSDTASAAAKRARYYHVRPGITFNAAHGPNRVQYAINNKIKGAIDHSHRGSTIRIMSWNIMSRSAVDHLLQAQRRGARVLALMDSVNWSDEVPNPDFRRLKRGLRQGNHGRPRSRWSAAKVCHGSCRGGGGLAHSKYYLFSRAGRSADVVMEGSSNLTVAAATNQWDDIFTFVNRRPIYNFAVAIFNQMWQDRPVANPWRQATQGAFTLAFSPDAGRYFHGDPVTNILSQVKCAGAVYGNRAHHTIIRLFPDVMRGDRGLRNARQIKSLWNRGCDVEVGYTVLSYKAHKVLVSASGRGPVPMHHMVEDYNGDGQFDNYFHMKVLSVNGVIGGNRAAFRAVNGSSNLSGLASASDENIGVFTVRKVVLRYQKHLTYWFDHAPAASISSTHQPPPDAANARMFAATGDPALLLRTPTGAPAAQPDGYIAPGTKVVSPTTGQVVDPYAQIPMD